MKKLLFTVFFATVMASIWGQTGCPDCTTMLPDNLPVDTIFIGQLPDGKVGEPYDADISFRMPKSTTPVAASDSTVLPNIPLDRITIEGISDVPEGIAWEANQLEFIVTQETDGCAKFCGIPTEPGLYMLEVTLRARIIIVDQTSSFFVSLYIAPASSETEGFSMENNIGCGATTVNFRNNIPSLGEEGYSYFWDFGNGKTSMEENPNAQSYNSPGEYPVSYQAIIDTTGFILRSVTIREGDCTDIIGAPDYYIAVLDPNGNQLISTTHRPNEPLPITFDLDLLLKKEGTYMLQVTDEDGGLDGSDDRCAEIPFVVTDTVAVLNGVVADLNIINPQDTITSVDTVIVYAFPTSPNISASYNTTLCEGDTVTLKVSNYENNLQWTKDNVAIEGATGAFLEVTETGSYAVSYTSIGGCSVVALPEAIAFSTPPTLPIFDSKDNLLVILEESNLPIDYELAWFLDGILIEDAEATTLCATTSGSYTLLVTDTQTGCQSSYTDTLAYNPSIENCNLSNITAVILDELQIFPNPTSNELSIQFSQTKPVNISLELIDILGRVHQKQLLPSENEVSLTLSLAHLPKGIYWLKLMDGKRYSTYKVVKQ